MSEILSRNNTAELFATAPLQLSDGGSISVAGCDGRRRWREDRRTDEQAGRRVLLIQLDRTMIDAARLSSHVSLTDDNTTASGRLDWGQRQ